MHRSSKLVSAGLAALALTGLSRVTEAQQTEIIFNLTVSRHSTLSTDGNASQKLSDATGYLKSLNSSTCNPPDVVCCIKLNKYGVTTTFSDAGLDIIDDSGELVMVLGGAVGQQHYRVVREIHYCGGLMGIDADGFSNQCQLPRRMAIIEAAPAEVWAHEFGHTQCLTHADGAGCPRYLMYDPPLAGNLRDVVTAAHCNTLTTPNADYSYGGTCYTGAPDPFYSYYVPMSGTSNTGATAIRDLRMCPNNDGGSSLPNSARIKVILHDSNDLPIPGVSRYNISCELNGGTAAQGFSGDGADSIIANSTYNYSPYCPNVRSVYADFDTDVNGTTIITFGGYGGRNPDRKWGHYDSEIPVYVNGQRLDGRLTASPFSVSYVLQVKNFDWSGGLGTLVNTGESVTIADFNGVTNHIGVNDEISYWLDFDSNGAVNITDSNLVTAHLNHDCNSPFNP